MESTINHQSYSHKTIVAASCVPIVAAMAISSSLLAYKEQFVDFPESATNYNYHSVSKYILSTTFNIENEEVNTFINSHQLADFLIWINQPIISIFGNIGKTLHLEKKWNEEGDCLILTLYSTLDDMDKLTELEDKLFDELSRNNKLSFIGDVVIAQG